MGAKPKLNAEQLLEQALQLPKEQRLRLVEQLRESVEEETWPQDLLPAWREEIDRHLAKPDRSDGMPRDEEDTSRDLLPKYQD